MAAQHLRQAAKLERRAKLAWRGIGWRHNELP